MGMPKNIVLDVKIDYLAVCNAMRRRLHPEPIHLNLYDHLSLCGVAMVGILLNGLWTSKRVLTLFWHLWMFVGIMRLIAFHVAKNQSPLQRSHQYDKGQHLWSRVNGFQ